MLRNIRCWMHPHGRLWARFFHAQFISFLECCGLLLLLFLLLLHLLVLCFLWCCGSCVLVLGWRRCGPVMRQAFWRWAGGGAAHLRSSAVKRQRDNETDFGAMVFLSSLDFAHTFLYWLQVFFHIFSPLKHEMQRFLLCSVGAISCW